MSLVVLGQTQKSEKLLLEALSFDSVFQGQIVEYVNKFQNDTNALHCLKFDMVVAYRVNEDYFASGDISKAELYSIVDRKSKTLSPKVSSQKKLTTTQIDTLKKLFSNDVNFLWSGCMTPIPQAGFVFYKSNKIIGYVNIACNYGHARGSFNSLENKWGGLSDQGRKTLENLSKELGVFFITSK